MKDVKSTKMMMMMLIWIPLLLSPTRNNNRAIIKNKENVLIADLIFMFYCNIHHYVLLLFALSNW